jgi:hypothetical protein
MHVARSFVPIAPSSPSSHEQGCGSHTEENHPSMNRRNDKGHAAPKNKKAASLIHLIRSTTHSCFQPCDTTTRTRRFTGASTPTTCASRRS